MLKDVASFLSGRNITYWLTTGTLLGALRSQDIIPGTADVDLFVPAASWAAMTEMKSLTFEGGRTYDVAFDEGAVGRICRTDGPGPKRHGAQGFNDLFKDEDFYMDIVADKLKVHRAIIKAGQHLVYPLRPVTIRGVEFQAPRQPAVLMEAMYGDSWHVPDHRAHGNSAAYPYEHLSPTQFEARLATMGDGAPGLARMGRPETADEDGIPMCTVFLCAGALVLALHVCVSLALMASKPAGTPATEGRGPRLEYISGMRAMVGVAIIVSHFAVSHEDSEARYTFAKHMAKVGLSYLVMLSGFLTHYAYRSRVASESLAIFYMRRFAPILPVYFAALVLGWAVNQNDTVGPAAYRVGYWTSLGVWFPLFTGDVTHVWGDAKEGYNVSIWTVATLIWIWLLYPFFARWLMRVTADKKAWHLHLLGVGLPCLFAALCTPFAWGKGDLFRIAHVSVPTNAFRFFPGVLVAEIVLAAPVKKHWTWGAIHDLLSVAILLLAAFLPGGTHDANPFSNFCSLALIAGVLLAAPFATTSPLLRLLASSFPTSLGAYSFELYAFQCPVAVAYGAWVGPLGSPQTFGTYFIALAAFAVSFHLLVVKPITACTAPRIAAYAKRSQPQSLPVAVVGKVKATYVQAPSTPTAAE